MTVSARAGERPLVSVVIPAYNEEDALAACLDTLARQTYPRMEVIVVDDGSTDATPEIARGKGVRVLEADHRGPAAARNLGAREARGEILVLVDADMTFDPRYVEALTDPILRGGAAGTFTIEEYVANPENGWARCWSLNLGLPPERRIHADHPAESTLFRALPRQRFLEVGGYTEGVGYTDDETLASKLGARSRVAPGAICYHQNPPDLTEVYRQARWIGRGDRFVGKPHYLLIYSPPVALLRGVLGALRTGELRLPVFKVVHDAGLCAGILSRMRTGHQAK